MIRLKKAFSAILIFWGICLGSTLIFLSLGNFYLWMTTKIGDYAGGVAFVILGTVVCGLMGSLGLGEGCGEFGEGVDFED